MLNPAEAYLSKEIKTRSGKGNNLRTRFPDVFDKKIGMPGGNVAGESSIDMEIELAMEGAANPKMENVDSLSAVMKHSSKETKLPNEIKSALKNLYTSFTGYAKKAYDSARSKSKKFNGFVKLTLYKVIRVFEYILTLTTPQWNRVMGSPEDLDTHAMNLCQKDSVEGENFEYQADFQFLKYRA